ncbi:MAG TPA: hypothetical protein VGQ09_19110 [Chitinophagaceae bacterium]|jgi:hypothetical protein|nr:hypothetical protein [Chitinophagaceae bacterium]
MIPTIEEVYNKAIELFKSSIVNDSLVKTKGKVETPIPILEASGNINSWFVGITVDKTLAGFLQIENNLSLLRYSSFQRTPNSLQGCPSADVWLNPKKIISLARTKATKDDSLSPPILTYDQNPSRIVWSIIATSKSGKKRIIYVAGEYVYVLSS